MVFGHITKPEDRLNTLRNKTLGSASRDRANNLLFTLSQFRPS